MNNTIGSNHTQISKAVNDCMPQHRLQHSLAVGVVALGLALSLASPVNADIFTVANTNDSGPGSFRQAILDSEANHVEDSIVFSSSVSGDINLASDLPKISKSLSILGRGDAVSINDGDLVIANLGTPGSYQNTVRLENLTINGDVRGDSDARNRYYDNTRYVSLSYCNVQSVSSAARQMRIHDSAVTGVSSSYGHVSIEDTRIIGGTGISTSASSNYYPTYFHSGSITAERVVISGNSSAARLSGGETIIRGSRIINNDSGITSSALLTIEDTEIAGNAEFGLLIQTNRHSPLPETKVTVATFENNDGPGIHNGSYYGAGLLSITNTTISGNKEAGIYLYEPGDFTITQSTITDNAGGIVQRDTSSGFINSSIDIHNSIIAGNATSVVPDIIATTAVKADYSLIEIPGSTQITEVSPGSNLIGVDPQLDQLQRSFIKTHTRTHALLPGSPAIDAGDSANCAATDQRGISRPQGAGCDMGAYELSTASMGNYVWNDVNGNGKQDDEPGLAGISVHLSSCGGKKLQEITTDATGHFVFEHLNPGVYELQFLLPANYNFSPEKAAGNYQLDSNANTTSGFSQCYTLAAGQQRLSIDAGMIPTAPAGSGVLGDYVWSDVNGNGKQDSNEPGLAGVAVDLQTCDGSYLDTTTSDAKGHYRFANLAEGSYQMQFHLPAGYQFSPEKAAGNYQLDSNAKPVTGLTQCYSMADNQERLAIDTGMVPDNSGSTDTVTILKAIYFSANKKLWVRAQSDVNPIGSADIKARMTVNGVERSVLRASRDGTVGWKASKGFYQTTFFNITEAPTSIILTSDQGGTVTGAVKVQ